MWFFSSPRIVFGEDSINFLDSVPCERACVVTDPNIIRLGLAEKVFEIFNRRGINFDVIDDVKSNPSFEVVTSGAKKIAAFAPDLIVGIGGGSVLDAAKGMWILYENPDLDAESINPIDEINLRERARFVAIPTTSGTGSEATWAIVLTEESTDRKLGLGNPKAIADVAILDPEFTRQLPQTLTVDTGFDVLTHAIEGYTSTFANDFCDGLCLKATQLVFTYLPKCYKDADDMDARTHMQNAAAIAGLGFGNSMAALAHGMGHALGGVFHIPHGRAVGMCLPYTIEYCREMNNERYADLIDIADIKIENNQNPVDALASAIRGLAQSLNFPLDLQSAGINKVDYDQKIDLLVSHAMGDTQTIMSTRIPDDDEMRKLFNYVFDGKQIDF